MSERPDLSDLDVTRNVAVGEKYTVGGFSDISRGVLEQNGREIDVAIKHIRIKGIAYTEDARERLWKDDVDLLHSDDHWDLHDIAGLLKRFLSYLTHSILTRELYRKLWMCWALTMCDGNIRWLASEIFLDNVKPSRASDVYSFGCLLLVIATRAPPFRGLENVQIVSALLTGQSPASDGAEYPELSVDDPLWKLMSYCWRHKYEDRPTMEWVEAELWDKAAIQGPPSRHRAEMKRGPMSMGGRMLHEFHISLANRQPMTQIPILAEDIYLELGQEIEGGAVFKYNT
ncbi:hypothetical protein FRC03_000315 [Tulasnella sp. 419]|nr:hypothetical protein FRC03_000315 [Tulasnella sp. 419]